MSQALRVFGAVVGATAMVLAVEIDLAQAGTYPKGGTYHDGGAGATVEPAPDPTTLSTMSFAPQVRVELPCGAAPWGGGCG
ncbi:hypothetical protein [Mycobacterium sp. NAZ190054]|uniref:hypothetical protein n=1 Tax=Mycobacterium sp. NAZ190054 TaxID=1747766 RepID=UPI000798D2BA|nr:hypothetical protein [Mycobacterium sp. NAZ190054]KWX66540.1 hypothetical protein ASJ79_25105 [Mycobacterium sp. NAZ190054]